MVIYRYISDINVLCSIHCKRISLLNVESTFLFFFLFVYLFFNVYYLVLFCIHVCVDVVIEKKVIVTVTLQGKCKRV